MNNIIDLQKNTGIDFKDASLLTLALTHSSYVNENPAIAPNSNERLEFLGDAILDMVIAEELYFKYPDYNEGELTGLRAILVCSTTLGNIARGIGLGDSLLLGKGEEASGGRAKEANLAGAIEALIAAVYLDRGLVPARNFIIKLFETEMKKLNEQEMCMDYKSRLQHIFQSKKGSNKETPYYNIIEATGPDHKHIFTAEVKVGDTLLGTGHGKSKKIAETEAARIALEKLK
ncbi:MAG: ribonuclease III [Dehalococcoidales bacterium]|nr:ribonuclease III [Dehalococcoidales bacterium]